MRKKETCPACEKETFNMEYSCAPEFPNEGFCDNCGFQYSSEFPQSPTVQGKMWREYITDQERKVNQERALGSLFTETPTDDEFAHLFEE